MNTKNLDDASHAYWKALEQEGAKGITTHMKGTSGFRNVLIIAVPFDTFDELITNTGNAIGRFAESYRKERE